MSTFPFNFVLKDRIWLIVRKDCCIEPINLQYNIDMMWRQICDQERLYVCEDLRFGFDEFFEFDRDFLEDVVKLIEDEILKRDEN